MLYTNTNQRTSSVDFPCIPASVAQHQPASGNYCYPIIDSNLTAVQALAQNPNSPAPQNILDQQRLFTVRYWGFDGRLHQGQMVMNAAVVSDVQAFFSLALKLHFPIRHAIPAADPRYQWSDDAMMADDNSSGYNFRTIAGRTTLSNHALGLAFDINDRENIYEYIDDSGNLVVQPPGATYNPSAPGTLTANSPLVRFMEARGWTWGGTWTLAHDGVTDYQHFEKPSAIQQP